MNPPLPNLRNWLLTKEYLREVDDLIEKHGIPEVAIAYNMYPHSGAVGRYLKRRFGVPFVVIVADGPARGTFSSREKHDEELAAADGCVFLSWGYFTRFGGRVPSLHFEGGVDEPLVYGEQEYPSDRRVVMYCGSTGVHTGLSTLFEAVPLLRTAQVEVWIAGGGATQGGAIACEGAIRVVSLGFLSESALAEKMKHATVFVNPYSTKHAANNDNFPSKVLAYMRYMRPIVTTWTDGLSPEYRDILVVAREDSPKGLAVAIDEVLKWDNGTLYKTRARLEKFVRERSWDKQGGRLLQWLRDSVLAS